MKRFRRHAFSFVAALAALAAAATALAVVAPHHGSSSGACSARWPQTAAGRPSTSGGDIALWRDSSGWHLRAMAGAGHVSGWIAARPLKLLREVRSSGDRVTRSGQRVTFSLRAGTRTKGLDFTAPCAKRLQIAVASSLHNRPALLGRSGRAPTQKFELDSPAATGVSGQTVAGPTCPNAPVNGNSCPDKPVQTTVEIRTAPSSKGGGNGTLVKTVATDSNGRFHTDLSSGRYELKPRSPGGHLAAKPSIVEVDPGVVSSVTLYLDTGIR